ncbi:DUF6069 family protein [Euzebya sp.]|uniref:DUF6069 family protein n=1 Tax=Euzebya sp. TaxID=1971409 RepID=UPI003510F95E
MAGASPVQTQEDLVPPAPAAIGYRLAGVVLAPAVAVVVHLVLAGPVGLDLQVPETPGSSTLTELSLLTTFGVALVLALAGWALVRALEAFLGGPRGRRLWTTIAVGVAVLSLIPVALLDIDAGAKLGLVGLHLAVALVLIPSLANGTPAEPLHRDT